MTQQKTTELLELPLTNEIGMALIDYLREGRPGSSEPYMFLALGALYQPLSKDNHLHQLLNKYIRRPGVVFCADKAHGMHSLRHTPASGLMEQGTPLPVISGILRYFDQYCMLHCSTPHDTPAFMLHSVLLWTQGIRGNRTDFGNHRFKEWHSFYKGNKGLPRPYHSIV